jgi:cytidine deaminase
VIDIPDFRGVIPAADAARLAEAQGTSVERLMTELLPFAATFARPPISNFRVGAVARGLSGALYLGTNVEFAGEALSFTVHAEQSAITSAWMNGETGVDVIAVSAAPCGYCRQFLNELSTSEQLDVTVGAQTRKLAELLPSSFGPRDLGIAGGLMAREEHALNIGETEPLARAALDAARTSYAPYSQAFAGVALRMTDGLVVRGAYAENAAFNPSMSPLEVALSQVVLHARQFSEIAEVVLVQTASLHTSATRTVLAAVCSAPLRVIEARNSA